MRNIFLIARREYIERVHTKAFLVSLLVFPLLMVLGFSVPLYFSSHQTGQKNIVVVTSDAALGNALISQMTTNAANAATLHLTLLAPTPALQQQLNAQVQSKQINGYLWLPSNPLPPPSSSDINPKPTYTSNSAGDLQLVGSLERALQHARAQQLLAQKGMSSGEIQTIFAPASIDVVQVSDGKKSNAFGTYLASLALMFMLYGSLMSQGFAISRSVIEEKTSRIFEVMLSILTPQEMLAGKLLGVGAVGLTQLAVWVGSGLFFSGPGLVAIHGAGGFSLHLAPWNLAAFLVCFVLGFFFYSALSAMMGSLVSSEQELQQLNLFITLPLIICVLFFNVVLNDPSGRIATVLSLLPPFAPLLMYLRIAVQTPPVWQIALSLVLMLGGVWFAIWLASRIYRVGILMYGKRPTLPELLRWLKYS